MNFSETLFMGKLIKTPIIASSCIATETETSILNLAKNNVSGAILKSCADYIRCEFKGNRQFVKNNSDGYFYASSPFQREIMTLEECIELLISLRSKTDILLIPSFTACSIEPSDWIKPCKLFEKNGADAIQLDFFYMGNLIGMDNFSQKLTVLLIELQNAIQIPIMPKININLPKDFILPLLKNAGIKYVSLLDSVRVPCVEIKDGVAKINARLDIETTSCFGSWQLPLTLGYTYTATQNSLIVCAGGGVQSYDDVKKLISVGATTVQSATWLTRDIRAFH